MWLIYAQKLPVAAGVLVTSFAVGVANNLINNLPLRPIARSMLHAVHGKGLTCTGSSPIVATASRELTFGSFVRGFRAIGQQAIAQL
jgi:hypothetical protein